MEPMRRGFTLVEMMVAVVIMALVIGLLLPELGKAVDAGYSAKCLSNMRQIGAAHGLYGADNDNRLVPIYGSVAGTPTVWRAILAPYLNENTGEMRIFKCPADRSPLPSAAQMRAVLGQQPTSYGINSEGSLQNGPHDYYGFAPRNNRLSIIKRPASTIFLSDLGRPANAAAPISAWKDTARPATASNYGYARFPSDSSFYSGDNWDIFPRHRGLANVLYYDGHAGSVDIARDIVPYPPSSPQCLYGNQ